MNLILIRHVETLHNQSGVIMGRSVDSIITQEGTKRFERTLRDFCTRVSIPNNALMLCSPARRCLQTMKLVVDVLGIDWLVEVTPSLNETDYGDFEGKSVDEVRERFPHLMETWLRKPANIRFPKGETFGEVQERALSKVRELESVYLDKTVLMCTHVDVIKMILCGLLEMSIDMKPFFDISNGSFTYISSSYRGLVVRMVNFV
ncbi:MAG: histidine phosphatase family protein [Patescibacteria group bacterium]